MFRKILIANRGEIACRVMRTARRMGISSVAVYSDADRNALHVEMADEAVAIGPAAAADSYLRIERIIEACRHSGAEAVHPGYGFLSENAAFVRALEAAGIAFIGPPAAAIEAMGDKIESKRRAAAAGVRVVPGHPDAVAGEDEAARLAEEIGYPVMLKASAGGGGKGMRLAANAAEAREGFRRAASEARSAFGDDRIFIEKYIEQPRHIEIQVLADAHGGMVHLGERECSIQRRHQKVIEEAPSPFVDPAMREAMGAQALALAEAVGYRSAGTVEFIAGADRGFYFLEMNTRLQVEHPVTELVTGIDLVEEMIRIAAGQPLRLRQADVTFSGWAVEARIYAEDPYRGFLPSTGRLTRFRPPQDGSSDGVTIRTDTGVTEGGDIPLHYDPMIAKLCTHAADRRAATDAMAAALDGFVLEGVRHNIPFLSALMAHPRWRAGRLSTGFIGEEFPEGFHGVSADAALRDTLAAVTFHAQLAERQRLDRLPGRLAPHPGRQRRDWVVMLGREAVPAELLDCDDRDGARLRLALHGGAAVEVASGWRPGESVWRGTVGGRQVVAQVAAHADAVRVSHAGATCVARLLTPHAAALAALMPERQEPDTSKLLLCPMPGLVTAITVTEGQTVEAGETLAVVEAMKMENVLRAERRAVVARICARAGESLAVDAVILEFG